NLLGYIYWIPQRLEIQFSASRGGSLPGTTGCNHEGTYGLSVINTTTEKQTANGISEGKVFRKRFTSIYQRFSFLITSSVTIPEELNTYLFFGSVSHSLFNYLCHQVIRQVCISFAWFQIGTKIGIPCARSLVSLFEWRTCQTNQVGNAFSAQTSMRCLGVFLCTCFTLRILHRFWTTLHGSCEDIGWLQRTRTSLCSVDGTGRFKEILHEISNHSPLYFTNTKRFFSKMGLTCHISKIHSEASVDKNAWELKQYIEELYWGSAKVEWMQLQLFPCTGLSSRARSKHKLPIDELPIISFHTEASTAPTVLATLTRVTQAELLPWLPLPRFFVSASEFIESMLASLKVPVVAPVSAAMAFTALHLQLRYGERSRGRSDGLVTRRDAEVPGSVVVRPERRLDHAWMVYSTLKKGSAEADASEMCEVLLAMLVEIDRKRKFC
ncbi:LOW QUALITY PROTEIN: hypothetical protein U9M48_044026, partial [Paspalum notatum var. saurae]